tara:strand:- start:6 stop:599 length:594 start_codon:yes stop_codon:yes gene_type:complete
MKRYFFIFREICIFWTKVFLIPLLINFPEVGYSKVLSVRSSLGATFCGEKVIREGDPIKSTCEVRTQHNSNIYFQKGANIFSFGEDSIATLDSSNKIQLKSGTLRVKTEVDLIITTPRAQIELSQGDLLIKESPFLGETEVVSLKGVVKLSSKSEKNDYVDIHPNHWGGLGGRFNKKIGDLVRLKPDQVNVFRSILD